MKLLALCLAFATAAAAQPAASEPQPAPAQPIYQLRYTPADAGVTGVALALWITSETLKSTLAPRACRWCDRAADGTDTLNAFDAAGRGLRWDGAQGTADALSNWVGLVGLPLGLAALDLALAGLDGEPRRFLADGLILVEVVALSSLFNQVVKFSAGRERPFVHALPAAERELTPSPADNNLSFFSGHTQYAVSLAVAAGTVAALRNYRYARWVWALGVPLAVATAYFRVAADKHYLTDVLVGAAAGAAFGYLVPTLLHPREGTSAKGLMVRLVPAGNGVALTGAF